MNYPESVLLDTEFNIFLKSINFLSYTEKYTHWVAFLDVQQQQNKEKYSIYLDLFLEQYPFNFLYWTKYCALKTQGLGKAYLYALQKIPKCFELWRLYIDYVKDSNNPVLYKKQLEKAIVEIGADIHSYRFFQEYYALITDNNNKLEFFKKLFTRALIGLQSFMDKFNIWIQSLNNQQLQAIYAKQTKGQGTQTQYLQYFKHEMNKIYKKTLDYRQKRIQIESQIKHFYFSDAPQRPLEYQYWRKYIALERKNNIVENISYCYQRAFTCQTENLKLWEQVFYYLENEIGKYVKVLNILRSNGKFFLNFNSQLYYYWCDLEQRENPQKARDMYLTFQKYKPEVQTFIRHIQLQIREKELGNAKNLYDTMLGLYQLDLQLLSYIVVEYANFVVKKYKDVEYPKKLLKSYFQGLPYNHYLFTNYLQFMKHFENKQGYYDELMGIISLALSKAKKSLLQKQFHQVITLIKHHLRTVLGSIYLIKISEKKMLEFEEKIEEKTEE